MEEAVLESMTKRRSILACCKKNKDSEKDHFARSELKKLYYWEYINHLDKGHKFYYLRYRDQYGRPEYDFNERWLPVPESDCFLSDLGRVRSVIGEISYGFKVEKYYYFNSRKQGVIPPRRVDQWIVKLFMGGELKSVKHKNGNLLDNRLDNLEVVDDLKIKDHDVKVKIKRTDPENDKITMFPSMREASRITGINVSQISRACKNGTLCKGFYWEKYSEEKEQFINHTNSILQMYYQCFE